jgi:hypothetical protein
MGVINQNTVRAELAADIARHITNAKFVAGYLADPGKKSPAITVTSRGTADTSVGYDHLLTIHLLVVAGKASGWTEDKAEDALDDLRNAFDQYIAIGAYSPQRDGASTIQLVEIPEGGEPYLDEEIPIRVSILDPH